MGTKKPLVVTQGAIGYALSEALGVEDGEVGCALSGGLGPIGFDALLFLVPSGIAFIVEDGLAVFIGGFPLDATASEGFLSGAAISAGDEVENVRELSGREGSLTLAD